MKINKCVLLYTMTSGLGDFIVMGDLIRKIESINAKVHCLMVHRNNPHVRLWTRDPQIKRFFNIYSPSQFTKLFSTLKTLRKEGHIAFGLQMAPGSLQGFLFYSFLKKLSAIDYIVDFNLVNADIITPPEGNYILDLHLNQIKTLLKVEVPEKYYHLRVPIETAGQHFDKKDGNFLIGIHPWSRRGHLPCFVWPFEKWAEVIKALPEDNNHKIIIFGKDRKFEELRNYLKGSLGDKYKKITFQACSTVQELIGVIEAMDLLITVNTSVIHIGYALCKKMVILSGPSLDLWTPKGEGISVITDQSAGLSGSDKYINDSRFPSVGRIEAAKVIDAVKAQFFSKRQ